MKRYYLSIIALFAFTLASTACENVDRANDKIKECLEDEYGEEEAQSLFSEWELDCEDGDEACDQCVECVMDEKCDALLDGSCDDTCH